MTYEIALGDRAYSSWSMRGWLLFDHFGIPCKARHARLGSDAFTTLMRDFQPARTVPAVRFPEVTIADSLAIAEELATRHPEAGLWPKAPAARAIARSLAAEMHSGFVPLRRACTMNLRVSYSEFPIDETVTANLARLETIWAHARQACGGEGPWLCGGYSAADAFFAPVAARIAGYNLAVSTSAQAYVEAHLADPAFRRWRAMALVDGDDRLEYFHDNPRRDWPGAAALPARAVEDGAPENAVCPYSGDPVAHLMQYEGRIFGFCNGFCRDKTVADPEVWPEFVKLLGR
uniref:glutathione S-transferase n=1 Tax=Pararhizobium sp. IMCC3301 TaxID=3067904 RepID=UPI0027422CA7|nr:glutathione S-transferase [Pararhizobium sp. IMCC3301]